MPHGVRLPTPSALWLCVIIWSILRDMTYKTQFAPLTTLQCYAKILETPTESRYVAHDKNCRFHTPLRRVAQPAFLLRTKKNVTRPTQPYNIELTRLLIPTVMMRLCFDLITTLGACCGTNKSTISESQFNSFSSPDLTSIVFPVSLDWGFPFVGFNVLVFRWFPSVGLTIPFHFLGMFPTVF